MIKGCIVPLETRNLIDSGTLKITQIVSPEKFQENDVIGFWNDSTKKHIIIQTGYALDETYRKTSRI